MRSHTHPTQYQALQARLAALPLDLAAARAETPRPTRAELAAQARTMRALGYRRSVGGVWVADRRIK